MNENVIKHVYLSLLNGNSTFDMFSELETRKGYVDIFFRNKNNLSIYNILIELKYIKKENIKTYDKVYEDALEEIKKYVIDKRLDKTNLKKYIVIFIGSEYKIAEVE